MTVLSRAVHDPSVAEDVDRAVGGGHLQLGQQGEPVAVEAALPVESEAAAEPAVAEQHVEAVLAGVPGR